MDSDYQLLRPISILIAMGIPIENIKYLITVVHIQGLVVSIPNVFAVEEYANVVI